MLLCRQIFAFLMQSGINLRLRRFSTKGRMTPPMRTFRHWLRLASLLISCVAISRPLMAAEGLPADAHELKIGETAPDFSLRGVDGKMNSLADFRQARVLMVV